MSGDDAAATSLYELPPLDRSGILFGFGFGELVVLGVVSVICFGLIQAGVPFWLYAPLTLGSLVAVRRPWPGGLQLLEYQPILAERIRRRRRGVSWRAGRPWSGTAGGDLPPSLTGIELATIRPTGFGPVGIVVDTAEAAATFVVELGSSSLLLQPSTEQAALLERWGRVVGASVTAGQSGVRHVSCTLISSQGSPRDHLRFVDRAGGQVVPTRIAGEYAQLIHRGAAATTSHRILFSVTVARHRTDTTAGWGLDEEATVEPAGPGPKRDDHYREVARSVVSVMHNLRSLGWTEQRLLGRDELLTLLGECVDPATRLGRTAQADQTLGSVLGLGGGAEPPTTLDEEREWVTINGVAHRSFWIRSWPNYGLPADWFIRLLADVEGERRFTVWFRPVPKTESARRYEREMAKHDSEELAASEKGKRVKLTNRRARQAVANLGEDLMAGYPEVELCAVVTISGANTRVLRRRCDAFASLAVSAGLQMVTLRDAQQLGWTHSLPFGLCPVKTRTPWS